MKKIVKYSSLAALGLVAAGVLAACSGGEKKDAASGEATSGKKEIVVFLHSVQGGSEGGFYFLAAFLPLPEPHDVQVGVAYHI